MMRLEWESAEGPQWDDYVEQFANRTFNYTYDKLKFDESFSEFLCANRSYILFENRVPIAVVPLMIEEISGVRYVSSAGAYLTAPLVSENLSYKRTEKVLAEVIQGIKDVGAQFGCCGIKLRMDPLSNPAMTNMMLNHNYLMEHGFQDQSILSRIVDMSSEGYEKEIRGNYLRIAKKAEMLFEYDVIDSTNVEMAHIRQFKDIYVSAAGFETHSMKYTDDYFDWVRNGNGVLVFCKLNDQPIATTLCLYYNQRAYYGFSAELPGITIPCPTGHGMQVELMRYIHKKGIRYYELGWQHYGKQPYDNPTEKEIRIAFFKRGFGGYNVPLYRGYFPLDQLSQQAERSSENK